MIWEIVKIQWNWMFWRKTMKDGGESKISKRLRCWASVWQLIRSSRFDWIRNDSETGVMSRSSRYDWIGERNLTAKNIWYHGPVVSIGPMVNLKGGIDEDRRFNTVDSIGVLRQRQHGSSRIDWTSDIVCSDQSCRNDRIGLSFCLSKNLETEYVRTRTGKNTVLIKFWIV